FLTQDRISVGHAKVLLALKSHEEQRLLSEEIIRRGLTVRAAEKLVADHFTKTGVGKPTRNGAPASPPTLAPAVHHLQNRLQQRLATHVAVRHGEKRGVIEIEYYGNDDLQRILGLIGLEAEER
ncbi:MAG: transcriptional regulator, partial [Chthoniobacteraceae bacterium]